MFCLGYQKKGWKLNSPCGISSGRFIVTLRYDLTPMVLKTLGNSSRSCFANLLKANEMGEREGGRDGIMDPLNRCSCTIWV